MRRTMISASSHSPTGQQQHSSSASPALSNSKRKPSTKQQPNRKQEQHVVIKTPPRPRSLVDDIDSPGTTATMMSSASSPPRAARRTTMGASFSPKLSPISHASSTAKQQEHRHRQQDLREPPSPFSPQFRKQQQQQQEEALQKTHHESKASSQDNTVVSKSQLPLELKTRVRESASTTTTETSGNGSSSDTNADDDYVDLTDLFVFLQRRDWDKVYTFLKEHPKSSRQTIHSKKGTTSLLHIVLRHGPPLPVLDVLLVQETPSSKVWTQTDTHGRLPLHAACSCGPATCLDVVSKLISVDPTALQVRTKDQHGRYPLHLAVVTNASEEVVMELMIHYPDASFKPDSHGKIPIEYAQDACYGHNRLVVALEWAPMFLAASQAAIRRVSEGTEAKLKSLREAHASYEEQLENRYNTEKMELLKEQILCSNELTNEKERNIALAETLLQIKDSQRELKREKDLLESKLERELLVRKARTKLRDEELRQILLGGKNERNNKNLDGENEGEKKEDQSETSDVNESTLSVALDAASTSNLPLPRLLKRISEGYETSKRRNEMYKKSLDRQRGIAKNLNLLLAAKENDLQQANRKSRANEITLQEALDRADEMAEKHQSALDELAIAKEEVERLKKMDSEKEQRYSHSQRRLKIQEKRLSGVQDLIESLKAAKAQAAERLDLIQEDEEESVSPIYEAGTGALPKKPSAAELSLDLSVEIEMAAMAAAQLEDSNSSNSSVDTSPSARRRAVDLSMELAAADCREMTPNAKGATGITVSPESMLKRFEVSSNRKGTSSWEKDKGGNWTKGTPQTLSVATATTASGGEDDFGDNSMNRSIPETPPVPKQVKSRSRQEYDQCSPLGALKLDFGLDS